MTIGSRSSRMHKPGPLRNAERSAVLHIIEPEFHGRFGGAPRGASTIRVPARGATHPFGVVLARTLEGGDLSWKGGEFEAIRSGAR